MVNHYFQSGIPMGRRSESLLHEDLLIECLKIYGFETFYLSRTEVNRDLILTEDPLSKFVHSHSIEMYMSGSTGFGGEGDLLTKFGVEFRDTATFIVSRRRWDELVGRTGTAPLSTRPSEGDIIFFPLTNSFFEIKKVDMLNPFFQVGKLYVYTLDCELVQLSSEEFDTGNEEIDDLVNVASLDLYGYQVILEDGTRMLLEYETDSAVLQELYNIDTIDGQSQNNDFANEVSDVLDFTESNPFGEVA